MRETEETQSQKSQFSKRLFAAYFSELVLFCLIIIYCILSPSLFSTIALLFMMMAISVNIARIYYLDEKKEILVVIPRDQCFIQPYALERKIWLVFTIINIGALFFKVIILATDSKSSYTENMQGFLEIQDLLHMFLPLIMLPFSIGSIFIEPRRKSLTKFRKQISQTIKIPAYFLLGGLCILVQIWSQSCIGMLYFLISLVIFWITSTSFQNRIYKFVVLMIQVCALLTISSSFLASTKLFQSFQWREYYETVGIDGVINFENSLKSGGHFLAQISLFFYCCILHRLFEYQKWNTKAIEKLEKYSLSIGEIFGQNIGIQSKKTDQDSPRKALKEKLLQEVDSPLFQKYGLPGKEYELKQLFREENSARRISLFPPMTLSEPKQRTWSFPYRPGTNSKGKQEHSSKRQSSSTKSVKQKKKEQAQKKRKKLLKFWKGFLKIVTDIINFLNSSDFTLRVAELISIVIIQRYNNVYSFIVLVWLAMIASVQNLKVVYLTTAIILLPMEVINYLIMFVYNIPHSFISDIQHKSLWGFQLMYAYWLDVIIFNVFLYYIILFVKAASKETRLSLYSKSKTLAEPSNWILAVAFIFRYTYLFTILAMFFMGFSNPTLINLGYVVLFFLFFTFGQNLTLEQKIKKKKQLYSDAYRQEKFYILTTLSRKFWFVIVYYTLTVIVLKYIYFLFFQDKATEVLDPIGINEIYNWAFNFSLTDVCKSNTTPFFIVFVLAETQIIIHRSNIYLNYSFSLIASSNDRKLKKDKEKKVSSKYEKVKIIGQKVLCFCLEFYYQGLYYFGGIIILACSYSWNIVQLPLVVLTCVGLLNKFNKKLLISIVSIDLLFIFATYIFRFLKYNAVSSMFGTESTEALRKIALFCGFNLNQNEDLYEIVALNVVIVYFSVESYRLCHKLNEDRIDPKDIKEQASFHEQMRLKKKKGELHQSQYQPTVIDSQFEDEIFATRYQQGVIQATKTYYNTDLTKKYGWLKYLCKFFSFVIVDAVSIIVLICCLYFRLSISMFVFLVLYLVFYYFLFGKIGIYLTQINYTGKIETYLQSYNSLEKKLQQKDNPQKVENNRQKVKELQEFTHAAFCQILNLKYSWKKSIWVYSAIFSVTCLVLTYTAQFIVSDFFIQNIHWQNIQLAQNVLFILGFSVNNQTSFFRQVYFYYLMIIINVIEKLLIAFFQKEKEEATIELNVQKEFKEILKVEDPFFLTDGPQISKDFIIQQEVNERLCHIEDDEISDEDEFIEIDNNDYQKQVISTCNLLIYFNYKQAQIKINILYALLATMVRTYLWLMLINVYERSSFSAFLYLFTLFYFWFRKIEFTIVKDINKAAIIIFLIQYLMLLFDIQQNTSPLPIPNGKNLSLLQKYITDPDWLEFLVIGQNESKTSFILISFFINSIIIFVTELYFSGFQYLSKLCLKLTQQIWDRYDYIFQTILKTEVNQTLDLNYETYKSWKYRVLEFAYENFITNSYVIVSILILLLLSADHTYISLIMLIIVFVYIYMARYTKYGHEGKIFGYTKLFFNIFRIVEFFFISAFVIFGVPVIKTYIDSVPDFIGLQITLSEIFLVLFIQLWLDCTKSQEFYRITNEGLKKNHLKEMVRLRCLAYQSNNKFMLSLIKTFQEIMTFQLNIKQAQKIIKQWENTFKVEQIQSKNQNQSQLSMIEEIQENQKEASQALKAFRNQIRRKMQREEKESEQKTMVESLSSFLERNTNPSLSFSYFELMQFILKNNKKVLKKILKKQKIRIDIWDYNLQNYNKLEEQIIKCRQNLNEVGQRILEDYENFNLEYFQMIIQEEYENIDDGLNGVEGIAMNNIQIIGQKEQQAKLYKVITPKKLNLIINKKQDDQKIAKKLWFFILSNFNYFVLFMIVIYYTINPALMSFPLVLYIFAFYVVADKKYNNLIVIYLVIVIILAELFQLQFLSTSQWTAFFFYLPQNGSYHFSIGFLFFLFILILIDEEIKKYQGVNHTHPSEVESFQNACMRILANEEKNSDLYLWKMYFQDQEDYELINNPIFYAEEQISLYPQNLTEKPESQFGDIFYKNKPGVDFYPYIATIQIFLTIYLIFFYPLMTLLNQSDLQESFKYFTFSSNMIISILSHVVMIVIERRITLIGSENKHKELIKYVFTMIIFALFLVFIYYWASQTPPNEYQPQPALIAFSFFYFIYFFLSGLQVKYGYKKFKKINSFMVKRNFFSSIFVLIFIAIPFLYEIKCIMDWTFLKTSLQLFDWFKLFSIYVSSFKAKIQQIGTLETKLGQAVDWTGKIIGWIGFTLLLLIIFGPMILFSGLNPTAQPNLVNGGSFQLGIHVIGGNEFTLYSTSHFSNPPLTVTYEDFVNEGFQDVPELKSLTAYDLSRQFQNISFQTYSDNFWGISPPNYLFLKSAFNQSTYEMANNLSVQYQYRMTINYILNRQVSQTTASITTFQFPNNNGSLSFDIVSQLNKTFHTCNDKTTIPELYNSLIRLITSGTTYKPSPIFYEENDQTQRFLQNVTLKMTCVQNDSVETQNTNSIYWEVSLQGTQSGIQMYVFADLYQSLLGGLSFTAIYTSVILVVAGFIRSFLAGNLPLIPYEMNAKPQKILQICEAIGIHRERKQFKEEFLMYYELIDVIRSPEIIRKLGASYTTLITRSHRIRKYRQKSKEEKEKKKTL